MTQIGVHGRGRNASRDHYWGQGRKEGRCCPWGQRQKSRGRRCWGQQQKRRGQMDADGTGSARAAQATRSDTRGLGIGRLLAWAFAARGRSGQHGHHFRTVTSKTLARSLRKCLERDFFILSHKSPLRCWKSTACCLGPTCHHNNISQQRLRKTPQHKGGWVVAVVVSGHGNVHMRCRGSRACKAYPAAGA